MLIDNYITASERKYLSGDGSHEPYDFEARMVQVFGRKRINMTKFIQNLANEGAEISETISGTRMGKIYIYHLPYYAPFIRDEDSLRLTPKYLFGDKPELTVTFVQLEGITSALIEMFLRDEL